MCFYWQKIASAFILFYQLANWQNSTAFYVAIKQHKFSSLSSVTCCILLSVYIINLCMSWFVQSCLKFYNLLGKFEELARFRPNKQTAWNCCKWLDARWFHFDDNWTTITLLAYYCGMKTCFVFLQFIPKKKVNRMCVIFSFSVSFHPLQIKRKKRQKKRQKIKKKLRIRCRRYCYWTVKLCKKPVSVFCHIL